MMFLLQPNHCSIFVFVCGGLFCGRCARMPGGPGGDYGTKEQSRQHPKHFPASPLGQYYAGLEARALGQEVWEMRWLEVWWQEFPRRRLPEHRKEECPADSRPTRREQKPSANGLSRIGQRQREGTEEGEASGRRRAKVLAPRAERNDLSRLQSAR